MHDRRIEISLAHRLDDPARKTWLPPAEVVCALKIRAGDTVADVGAGTGYLTLPLVEAVGPAGKVYAVDAQAEMLALLEAKIVNAGIDNIELIHAAAEKAELPSSSCDLYVMANVWHELDDCEAAVREARRILKAGGKVAILDWRTDVEAEHGPPLAHRVGPHHAEKYLLAAGFDAISHGEPGLYSWLVQAEVRR